MLNVCVCNIVQKLSSSKNHDPCTENFSESKDEFEGNMYINGRTSTITPTSFFFLYFISHNETDSNLPSGVEIAFLLVIGACIPLLKLATEMMISQMFNVCNHDQDETSKMY